MINSELTGPWYCNKMKKMQVPTGIRPAIQTPPRLCSFSGHSRAILNRLKLPLGLITGGLLTKAITNGIGLFPQTRVQDRDRVMMNPPRDAVLVMVPVLRLQYRTPAKSCTRAGPDTYGKDHGTLGSSRPGAVCFSVPHVAHDRSFAQVVSSPAGPRVLFSALDCSLFYVCFCINHLALALCVRLLSWPLFTELCSVLDYDWLLVCLFA